MLCCLDKCSRTFQTIIIIKVVDVYRNIFSFILVPMHVIIKVDKDFDGMEMNNQLVFHYNHSLYYLFYTGSNRLDF